MQCFDPGKGISITDSIAICVTAQELLIQFIKGQPRTIHTSRITCVIGEGTLQHVQSVITANISMCQPYTE